MDENSKELIKIATAILIAAQEWSNLDISAPGHSVIEGLEKANKRLTQAVKVMKKDA